MALVWCRVLQTIITITLHAFEKRRHSSSRGSSSRSIHETMARDVEVRVSGGCGEVSGVGLPPALLVGEAKQGAANGRRAARSASLLPRAACCSVAET